MKLSIVLSTQPASFQAATFKGNLEENLQLIASLGYDGVELAIRDPRLLDMDALEKSILTCGLSVPAIGTGQAWGEEGLSFTDPDASIRRLAIERIISHLPAAQRFGAVLIIGLIRGIVKPGVEPAQAMDWLVEALQECCSEAIKFGVNLALEPINRYETTLINSTAQGLELIQRVGAGNFGLLLDTFHMNIEEPKHGGKHQGMRQAYLPLPRGGFQPLAPRRGSPGFPVHSFCTANHRVQGLGFGGVPATA